MGEFLAAIAKHKMMQSGGGQQAPDQSQPAPSPMMQPPQGAPMPQMDQGPAAPGFSDNVLGQPSQNLFQHIQALRQAPRDFMSDLKGDAAHALLKLFS